MGVHIMKIDKEDDSKIVSIAKVLKTDDEEKEKADAQIKMEN